MSALLEIRRCIQQKRAQLEKLKSQVEALEAAAEILSGDEDAAAPEASKETPPTEKSESWIPDAFRILEDGAPHEISELMAALKDKGHTVATKTVNLYISRAATKGRLKRIGRGVYAKA